MSNWRESDSEPPKKNSPARQVSATPPPASGSSSNSSGWRKGPGPTNTPTQPVPDWRREEAIAAPTSWHGLRKWSMISVLMLAVVVLSFVLVKKAFFGHPKLPLHVISVIDYEQAFELGRNPLASQCQPLIGSINKSYVVSNFISDGRILSQMADAAWRGLPNDPFVNRKCEATAWYICCYAALRPDGIDLYQENSSPFSTSQNAVDLKRVLESIAKYSSTNSRFAWVILDLRLPPATGSFGNLNPRWKSAAESVLKEIRSELRDQLVVTLPADDAETSWLAPEFSTSIFAHNLFSLLDSPPRGSWLDQLIERSVPLDTFRKELERGVAADAAQRRSTRQTPVWLPSENLQRFKTLGLASGGGSSSYKPMRAQSANLANMESLWKKLDDHYQAFRWDPVGYARAESLLLRLEQIATRDASGIDRTLTEAERMLERIHQPQRSYGASLIEDRSRRVFLSKSEGNLPEIDFLDEKYPEKLAGLDPGTKLLLLWNFAVQRARTGDQDLRKQFFAKEKLDQVLSLVVQSNTPPVELYLLQRIARDVDWNVDDKSKVDACASLVDCFDRLQYCSTRPDPVISTWLHAELGGYEGKFLKAVDQLFSGSYENAVRELKPITKDLREAVEPSIKEFEATLEAWREISYLAPHLMSWLLEEYRIAGPNEHKTIEDSLQMLGEAIQLCQDLNTHIAAELSRKDTPEKNGGLSEKPDLLRKHLASLTASFRKYVDQKTSSNPTSTAESSPLTFRRNLIALQSPLISIIQRETLHKNVSAFLQSVNPADRRMDETVETVPFRTVAPAIERLLEPINVNNPLRKSIEHMARSDLRNDFVTLGYFDHADELAIRMQSTTIGDLQHLASHQSLEHPWENWQRLEQDRCAWQCQRLALSGWGYEKIKDNSRQSFYFGRLAENYLRPSRVSVMLPEGSLRIAERAIDEACESLTSLDAKTSVASPSAANGWAEGEVSVSAVPKIMSYTISTSLRGLANQGELLNWQSSTINDHSPRLQSLNLVAPTIQVEAGRAAGRSRLRLAADYLNTPSHIGLTLSLRGNTRIVPLVPEKQSGELAVLEFERKRPAGARISVDASGDPPPINFAILIDCSESMNLEVPVIREGVGQGFNERLMNQVRRSVKGLLQELDTIHKEKSANVRLCIIPFGLAHYDALPSPLRNNLIKNRKSVSQSKEDQIAWLESERRKLELEISKTEDPKKRKSLQKSLPGVGHFYATKFSTPDSDHLFDVFVDQLEPTYDTPLYDAIIEACNQLGAREGDRYILVFSDGVNNTNPESPYKSDANTPASVESALNSSQSILKIFHFNYFDRWLNAKLSSPEAIERLKEARSSSPKDLRDEEADRDKFRNDQTKANEAGRRELTALTKNGKYELSDNADALAKKAIESLPRTRISIERISFTDDKKERKLVLEHIPLSGGRLDHRVKAEYLPSDFEVSVALPNGSKASKAISLIGGEFVNLRLISKAGKTHLEFPPFAPAIGKEWTKVERGTENLGFGGLSSDVWWNPDWSTSRSRDNSSKELNYRWAFLNRSEKNFTNKPEFIVGLLEFPSAERPYQSWTMADSWFEHDRHYPELRFPPVNIKQDGGAEAVVTLWVSDKFPSTLVGKKTVEKGQPTRVPGEGGVQIDWLSKGESQIVQVKVDYSKSKFGNSANRIFILNRSADSSQRYFGDNYEKHEFTHSETSTKAELEFITRDNLEKLVKDGVVTKITTKLPTVPPNN